MPSGQRAQLSVFAMTFLYALSVTMIGPLMPLIIDSFELRLSVAGLLVSFRQLGGIMAIVASALFADRTRKPLLIAGGFLVYSVSLFSAGVALTYIILAGSFFAIGASSRLFDAVANADTAQWNPHRSALHVSLLHTSFAVGALVGPLYVSTLVEAGVQWRGAFLGLGAAAVVAVAVYVTRSHFRHKISATAAAGVRAGSVAAVLRTPRMWIACAVMLFYVGHQAGFSVWLPMYLQTSLGAPARMAAAALSLYWFGIIVGRLLAARLAARVSIKRQLWAGGLAGSLVLLLTFATRNLQLLTTGSLLAGVASGGVIPNLVTLCCGWFAGNTATASSMLFLMAAVGHMVSPWLIAVVTELSSFDIGFTLPIAALGLVGVAALALPRR